MNYKKNYVIFIGILGTIFEWLEYSYFGYLTTKMSQLFFPHYDERVALLATMGIFAAGFIMRPIGGFLFGLIGDKKGRKSALFLSLFLMGCSTLMMGVLPTYQSIGIFAPLLLLFCRLLQGLAVSGEYNGASIFLIEHSKNNHPTLAGSWVGTASALGMVIGALAATIVTHPGMPSWAWRIPFFLAFFSCLIANYLRYRMLESPLFLAASRQHRIVKAPLKIILQHHKEAFIHNLILAAFVSIYIYICTVYFISYLIKDLHYAASDSTFIISIGQSFVVFTFPVMAYLADRVGHRIIMLIGLAGALIATPLLFISASTYSYPFILTAEIIFGLSNAMACAPVFNFIYRLFPTNIRYTGNSTAWGLGVALFGGSAPLLANFLMHRYSFYGPWFLVGIFACLSMYVVVKKGFAQFILKNESLIRH